MLDLSLKIESLKGPIMLSKELIVCVQNPKVKKNYALRSFWDIVCKGLSSEMQLELWGHHTKMDFARQHYPYIFAKVCKLYCSSYRGFLTGDENKAVLNAAVLNEPGGWEAWKHKRTD